MNTYRSLRDLPGAPKGTVGERIFLRDDVRTDFKSSYIRFGFIVIHENEIKSCPEYFELAQPESLEDAVEVVLNHLRDDGQCGGMCKKVENLRTVYNRIKQEGR